MRTYALYVMAFLCLFLNGQKSFAQYAVDAAGGEAISASGTVSYSVGQVVYTYQSIEDYSITAGVQQTYTGFLVAPKVFLQGALSGNTMSYGLSTDNILPTTEPYTALGYSHIKGGGETTTNIILNGFNVVDWVILELRDATDNTTIIETRSGLLLEDGRIVSNKDGSSPIFFGSPAGTYHLAVRHRNHLGVMTSGTVLFQ